MNSSLAHPEVSRTAKPFRFSDHAEYAASMPSEGALERLRWAVDTFGDRVAVASSFGAEDVVLIDLASRIGAPVRIFTIDTGRLPQETYDVMDACRRRYGVRFEVLVPEPVQLAELIASRGPNLFYASVENRRDCCHVRKVEPLQRVLATCDAWVTGIRRDQAVTRAGAEALELDLSNGGIFKVNPLVDWSEEELWAYIRANDVPYNELHDRGYPSIGCAPCTRAVGPGEDVRAGRWWWESPDSKECGLHR